MRLRINDSEIIWPGKMKKKPEGFFIPTHLKVLTIEEKPFVYVRKITDDRNYCEEDEIACPHFNVSEGRGETFYSIYFEKRRRK
jgi:glutamate receptor ionotropic, NMDA 1